MLGESRRLGLSFGASWLVGADLDNRAVLLQHG
jgi:hypothetical protein